jgi:hypothetical protein
VIIFLVYKKQCISYVFLKGAMFYLDQPIGNQPTFSFSCDNDGDGNLNVHRNFENKGPKAHKPSIKNFMILIFAEE